MSARILVIEDNAANLELMRYLLHAFGHEPLAAQDGAGGLARAGAEAPALILCDVQMPGMDGYAVLRAIRSDARLASIPVVAVTALAMVGDRDKAIAAGFDGYIAKPIDPVKFVGEVESFLPAALRAARPTPRHAATQSTPLAAKARATILVVDNLQVNLDLFASIAEPCGYRVVTTSTAEAALELARAAGPDLIVSDVCMPRGSGYDLIRAVKEDPRLRKIPFVFLTSTALNSSDRERGLAMGAARFLVRPMEPRELLGEIEACLLEAGKG